MISHDSRKEKGKRLQKWMAQKIADLTGLECGKDCPIESRQMGEAGPDVRLDSEARRLFPFTVECKNQENWCVPASITQARANTYPGTDWILVLSKNRFKPVVVMDAEAFFRLVGGKSAKEADNQEFSETPRTRVRTLFRS